MDSGGATGQGRAAPCSFSSAALRSGQGRAAARAAPRGQGRAGALSFNDLFASILTVPVQKIKIPTQHPNSLAQHPRFGHLAREGFLETTEAPWVLPLDALVCKERHDGEPRLHDAAAFDLRNHTFDDIRPGQN